MTPLESRARDFAAERHSEQKYGEAPYTVHLAAVRAVLADFDSHADLLTAAWLHDVVEDTGTSIDEVRTLFGDVVANMVWAVTGVGANRKERNASAYSKIRAYPVAAQLKLADRIANVEASRGVQGKLGMYRNEHPAFKDALAGLGPSAMWARLEAALK
jgi:(p)ppGpp synthase/HD superfamily hydrolase